MSASPNSGDYRPMSPQVKSILKGIVVLLLILAGLAITRTVMRRLDREKKPTDQTRTRSAAAPSRQKHASPAVAAFNAVETFLKEQPDALAEAQKQFEAVAYEHPGSAWGLKARTRAAELFEQRAQQDLAAWVALKDEGDAEKTLAGYTRLRETWHGHAVVQQADERLLTWINAHTRFIVKYVPDSIAGAVQLDLEYEGVIPAEDLRILWRIDGKRAGSKMSLKRSITEQKHHPVRLAVNVRHHPVYSREFNVDLSADAFAVWRYWVDHRMQSVPAFGRPHFRVTRTDGQVFLAVKTETGYRADLQFGPLAIAAQEVRTAVPAESPGPAILKGLDAAGSSRQDTDFILRKSRNPAVSLALVEALVWWALYLEPARRDIQEELGLISDCTRCRGMLEIRTIDTKNCSRCKALSRRKCNSCQGEGRLPCARRCRRGYITTIDYREDGRNIEQTVKCHVCGGKGKMICKHCKGVQRNMCDQCRRRGLVVVTKVCPLCAGKAPELIPFAGIRYPFLIHARNNPDPELEKVRAAIRQAQLKAQGLSGAGADEN